MSWKSSRKGQLQLFFIYFFFFKIKNLEFRNILRGRKVSIFFLKGKMDKKFPLERRSFPLLKVNSNENFAGRNGWSELTLLGVEGRRVLSDIRDLCMSYRVIIRDGQV